MSFAEKYYRTQEFIDIGYGEFSWFNDTLIDMMAIIYLLEKMGVIIEGSLVWMFILVFLGLCWIAGKILKFKKVYDTKKKVEATIDPVMEEIYKMALKYNKKND